MRCARWAASSAGVPRCWYPWWQRSAHGRNRDAPPTRCPPPTRALKANLPSHPGCATSARPAPARSAELIRRGRRRPRADARGVCVGGPRGHDHRQVASRYRLMVVISQPQGRLLIRADPQPAVAGPSSRWSCRCRTLGCASRNCTRPAPPPSSSGVIDLRWCIKFRLVIRGSHLVCRVGWGQPCHHTSFPAIACAHHPTGRSTHVTVRDPRDG